MSWHQCFCIKAKVVIADYLGRAQDLWQGSALRLSPVKLIKIRRLLRICNIKPPFKICFQNSFEFILFTIIYDWTLIYFMRHPKKTIQAFKSLSHWWPCISSYTTSSSMSLRPCSFRTKVLARLTLWHMGCFLLYEYIFVTYKVCMLYPAKNIIFVSDQPFSLQTDHSVYIRYETLD